MVATAATAIKGRQWWISSQLRSIDGGETSKPLLLLVVGENLQAPPHARRWIGVASYSPAITPARLTDASPPLKTTTKLCSLLLSSLTVVVSECQGDDYPLFVSVSAQPRRLNSGVV
ncbi:hypothetical protein Lalb_Chr12g0206131 [Lupinus albus]|uniref:Uncharacterized protein n=1 Tax=Lupinus albus TaxID=3870 RepID=A0A6A4PP70_LUPAL|nr:hypothetical protein Lalb_Chr12g0206131 [Lupinus albus]